MAEDETFPDNLIFCSPLVISNPSTSSSLPLTKSLDASMFHWYDYVLAVIWFGANFLFFFRSKLYWNLGKKPGYELTEQSAFGAGFRK